MEVNVGPHEEIKMSDLVGLAEIAKRLNLEVTTVRRMLARLGEGLQLIPRAFFFSLVQLPRIDL